MHNLKRPLLAVLPAPSLPMICLIFGLLGRVSARAQPPPVPMEQQKHLESPPTPMNPVNPVQQQITGMTTPANPLVSTATEPPPPPTSADNTTHPCRNPNIAACFHLIALQMNKTEELLQMANQTLSTASQAHDGSLAASVTSGVGNDTTVAPAVAQNSPSSPLVTSSPTAVAAPNSEMATHVENGASMPISARVTGHSKKELEEKKHRHKRSVEHKKKRFRVKHLKKKQGLPGKKTKRRRKGKKMKLKADRVKAVAAKSDGHHSSLMNEEVTAKSDDETDKKKLSEKSDKKVKKKHHKKNKEKHEMANEQEDGSGTAKNELAEKESWSKKESKKPSKSNEEEESSVEEKDAFLEDQLTSIEDISSAERVVIKKEESNLIKDIPYSDRVTLGDSQERLRIPQKHMLRFKRQAAVTQQTPASLASVQPPAPAQPSLESSANNTLFNNSVVGFEAKLEQELAAAPKGLILIVKEPGESNLIAGEQVDGNLNPIGANGTNTATNGTVNLMTPKIGLMNNKMGNMSEPSPPASNATLAPTLAPLVNGNLTQQPAAPVNGTASIVAPLAPINVTLAPGAAVAPTNVSALGGAVPPAPGAVPPAPVLPGSPGLTVTTLSPPVTGAVILNATVQTVAASIAPTPAPAINST